MIRLTDEQWEHILDHFPEENIGDGRPGRKSTPTLASKLTELHPLEAGFKIEWFHRTAGKSL
jgi:hypothetical protein